MTSAVHLSSGEVKETSFLFQRISVSVVIQRFNSARLHDSFVKDDPDHSSGESRICQGGLRRVKLLLLLYYNYYCTV